MAISRETILQAHERIKPFIHRTPVLVSHSLNQAWQCSVFFKCENFQKTGSFKARGATNAVMSLTQEEIARGVCTHSSGNHAQALARAAKLKETPAYIVMPRTAPEIKQRGVKIFGGEIFLCEPTLAAREEALQKIVAERKATVIHPYNDERVIAGQATAALEIFDEVKPDVLMTPVGGGGLLSGTALSAQFFSPATQVVAGEPAGSDDAFRSLQSGKIEAAQANTIADGLMTSLGTITFPIIQQQVKKIITVTDEEIFAAMRLINERLKIVIEPSSAVPVAALIKEKEFFYKKTVAIILSGGNVDMDRTYF